MAFNMEMQTVGVILNRGRTFATSRRVVISENMVYLLRASYLVIIGGNATI